MKNSFKKIVVIVSMLLMSSVYTFAQPPHPNGSGGSPTGGSSPVGGGAPVGSGLLLLLGMGAMYGSGKVYIFKKNK
jgi:hypothetical protein